MGISLILHGLQDPAPRRGVVLKNPVIQRYRLLRRVDSLLVQLFVSLHDMPLGNALALQHTVPHEPEQAHGVE